MLSNAIALADRRGPCQSFATMETRHVQGEWRRHETTRRTIVVGDLALEAADHAYVLQVGRTVLQGPAHEMADNPDVQKVYLGIE